MVFTANFTAIDFETASQRPDSACQLAAVIVRQGRIVDQAMWMIRPQPLYFSPMNIRIHGITPERVRREAVFGELWPEIARKLGDDCLVAHNASFDMGVLLACLRAGKLVIPELEFTCTRAIARRTWPHLGRFGLQPLATWLGVRFRHHDALEDSIACAKILLAAGIDREAASLGELEQRLRLRRGQAGPWGHRGPSGRGAAAAQSRAPRVAAPPPLPPFLPPPPAASRRSVRGGVTAGNNIDLQRLMIRAEFIRPWLGKRVVLAGRLRALDREQAELLATRLGGTCVQVVDEATDLIVMGEPRAGEAVDPRQASGQAERLRSAGIMIRLVNEDEFLGLVICNEQGS